MKIFLIKNQTSKVGGTNSAAGMQATNWNDEIMRVDGGAHAIADW
jgi:hypothetical protein